MVDCDWLEREWQQLRDRDRLHPANGGLSHPKPEQHRDGDDEQPDT
jgi:hypothetical protein